ncbi:MAG: hypothetical protein IJC09_05135 [Clostridia bacterium]|nr:hypothetical protein [Clostridia bacterium]
MKRLISLILSVMLMFSGITVANADATAVGIGINRWNGFVGGGVTTLNPTDNSDDVVKLTAGEETTLSLDNSVSGNMLITVEVYAESAQNSTITALASDATTVMGSFTTANTKFETGKWQTAKILVFPNGKIYRTYLNDSYLGEGEISGVSLSLGEIKFSAGGTLYINNISVYDYTTPVLENSKLRTVYSSNFAGTTSTTNKISSVDGWSCNASDSTIGYYLVPDPKNSSENAVKIARTATSGSTNRFAKGINFANASYEMKLYIPSKLDDGATDNPVNFKMFVRTDNSVNPTTVWIRSNGAATIGIPEVGRFTAPLDEWFTLKLNINMDAQTIDVYVGDEKVSDESISLLKADGTPATKCTEIDLEVPRENSSGIAYFKDIAINEQNPVKIEAKADKTIIYEQNFNDEAVGANVPGFTHGSRLEADTALTFTTAAGAAGSTSRVGMLYDPSYTDATAYRYTDAGETDTTAIKKDYKSQEWWSYDISEKTANLDNITLSFKYYNAKNVGNHEKYSWALSRDHLFAGFATGMGDTATGNMYYTGASSIAMYMKPGNQKVALMQNASRSNGTNVPISVGAWKDLSLTITKNADNTATAKIKSEATEDTYSLTSFPTISKLSFQLDELYGGKYYIDDIEVYSAQYTEEVLYTESELKDISTATIIPVYTNTITRNNVPTFTIDGINFSDGTANVSTENAVSSVAVTQWKNLDENVNAWLYTAVYNAEGRLLKAQKQELTAQALTEKGTVDIDDISCDGAEYAKAFIWSDDLAPLAEGYFVGKKITVWIAGSSTAQDYPAERYPQAGWGQMIDPYFYENSVTVNNKAVGGRSSKSFIQEGRLDEILASGQSGDYLFVWFGGNDASKKGMLEYTDPTLGWDVVDSNPDGYSEDASYKYYLKQYVDGARAKGMIPVFVTVLPMYSERNGQYVGSNYAAEHVEAMINLGEELGVPVSNVNSKFINAMESMSLEEVKKHYMIFKFADYANDPKFSPDYHIASGNYDAETDLYYDNVHITELGADLCAKFIADDIKNMPIGLSNYIK